MKVCVLVFVVVVCALLPSDGAAQGLRPGLHALAKRSVAVFSKQRNAHIDRRYGTTAFDKLYAELISDEEHDEDGYYENQINAFLNSNDVDEFLNDLGVPSSKIDERLEEKYPERTKEARELIKALALLSVAGYDIDVLFDDSSSEKTDE